MASLMPFSQRTLTTTVMKHVYMMSPHKLSWPSQAFLPSIMTANIPTYRPRKIVLLMTDDIERTKWKR